VPFVHWSFGSQHSFALVHERPCAMQHLSPVHERGWQHSEARLQFLPAGKQGPPPVPAVPAVAAVPPPPEVPDVPPLPDAASSPPPACPCSPGGVVLSPDAEHDSMPPPATAAHATQKLKRLFCTSVLLVRWS
jgi:hypothetical protein